MRILIHLHEAENGIAKIIFVIVIADREVIRQQFILKNGETLEHKFDIKQEDLDKNDFIAVRFSDN